ncbi:MAG: hypothetical protein FK734_17875 [Asgard group archaeon]|nr:hypothetical protein [Asgard group archaeon]
MRPTKLFPTIFLIAIFTVSITNISFTLAGYDTDPTGDEGGNSMVDITRIDVAVTYHSPPTDDEVILKITLADELIFDENTSGLLYAYNFFIDTDLSTNSNTSLLTVSDYEYHANLLISWSSDQWFYHSYLMATRYYYTGDGQGKTMGTYYWNPNTDSWQGTDPQLEVAVISGNTVSWDVTHAIFREQPIGTGYVIQGAASTNYNLNTAMDYAKASGWVDEFDNMCVNPGSNTSTPSLPAPGVLFSIVFIGLLTSGLAIIKKRKN